MKIFMFLIALLTASSASAQYRNFEIQPDGTGGYYGTDGNRNFEIYPQNGGSGHVGGRRPGVVRERPSQTPGNIGATQRNCQVDANGRAFCR